MALHPSYIKGVQFSERFFDAVIRGAGGMRLTDICSPLKDVKSADYIIDGFATELKVLVADPLDSAERQDRLERFLRAELPNGPLFVTAHRQEVSLRGELGKVYWEKYVGSAIPNRLQEASKQIRATHTFVPNLKGGAVILVNAGGPSLDWRSFINLTNHFQAPISEIDMVFAISGIPQREPDGQFHIHSALITKPKFREDSERLSTLIDTAIRKEIENCTGKASKVVPANVHSPAAKTLFRMTPDGIKLKNPIRPKT